METASYNYSALVIKTEKGFVGIVMEVPGAASQAPTMDILRERLKDAITCIYEANKASYFR